MSKKNKNEIDMSEEDLKDRNINLINMYIYVRSLPPIDIKDVNQLYMRFNMCLEYCLNNNILLGNQIIYFWCGINKDIVYNIERKKGKYYSDKHYDFIKYIKSFCAMNREAQGLAGIVNPAVTIFHQKAYDGMTDQPKQVLLPVIAAPALSQEDIIKQYGMQALTGSNKKEF